MSELMPITVKELAETLRFASDPEVILEKASRTLAEKEFGEMSLPEQREVAFSAGVGSQYSIADAVDPQYSTLVIAFARQLIQEYHCETASEVAVAELTAADYVQFASHSKSASVFRGDTVIRREIDRAHRRFLSALSALRMMKRPPVSVNLIAGQAFVAHNQVNSVTSDTK